jgi:hypothetical protein
MRNEEIKAELSALRAEVLALAEARKQSELRAVSQPEAPGAFEEHDDVEAEHDGFMGQVKELVELLEEELKETPVVSGLVIFSVGILVGRFLR